MHLSFLIFSWIHLFTLIILAIVSAPLNDKLHPVKLTDVIERDPFIALDSTAHENLINKSTISVWASFVYKHHTKPKQD